MNPPNLDVALFNAALELPASQRVAFLDEACADDRPLRQRIEGLLRVMRKHSHSLLLIGMEANQAPGAKAWPAS